MIPVGKELQNNFIQALAGQAVVSNQSKLIGSKYNFDWELSADRFLIGNSQVYIMNGVIGRQIYIESRAQMEGPVKWAVKMDQWVLGKDGEYHYEMQPSSRTDSFLENTRYETKEEALSTLLEHENEYAGKQAPKLYL